MVGRYASVRRLTLARSTRQARKVAKSVSSESISSARVLRREKSTAGPAIDRRAS
jgi:hypothetical protein